ncbi:hypothetical protein AB0N23_01650 [Streptomyces sp. NPDC052644]
MDWINAIKEDAALKEAQHAWDKGRNILVFKSTVILGRVTAGTWNRLAPQARPAPEDNTHPGRVHVVQGGQRPPDAGAAPDRCRSR